MIEDKIDDIEARILFQENTLQELNDVIYRQQLQIDKLENQVKQLQDKVKGQGDPLTGLASEEEKPPHY